MTKGWMSCSPIASTHKELIVPPARRAGPGSANCRGASGTILLTGGTGFLGREIIPRLIMTAGAQSIFVLIRGCDDDEACRRFHALVDSIRLRWPGLDLMRIRPLRGDVTLPWLGLDPKDARALAGGITRIVHAAASTRLNSSLTEARRANLGGTREVLRLAELCRRLQSLAWISTAFVAGDREGRIMERELQCGQGFRNAYEQSKFEAELMVRSVATRLPITIFRPSIIVGDSQDGYTCNFASIYWPLRLIAEGATRSVPGDPQAPLDLVPVDYVADAIVQLMKNDDAIGRCYQLVAGRSGTVSTRELLERAIRRFDRGGKPLSFVTPRMETDSRLRVFFAYLLSHKEFDDSDARAALRESGLRCPRVTDYLDQLFDFCERTDWGTQDHAGPGLHLLQAAPPLKGAAVC
jgi:thioester reductase-like protein